MNAAKLLALLPLAYIIWWFYTLFTWFIPLVSMRIVDSTWVSIILAVTFTFVGIPVLVICIVVFLAILTEG